MSGLGEQIAVLDGLDALDPNDGRIGQQRARVTQYARPQIPGVLTRRHVLDASEGANYSGGSSYHPGLPLLPSSIGLAAYDDYLEMQGLEGRRSRRARRKRRRARMFKAFKRMTPVGWTVGAAQRLRKRRQGMGNIPGVLPPQRNVIDPSGGANYTGGSDWVPGLPLTVSSAGLAADLIHGGYGREGLGAATIRGGYGRAGLGQTGTAIDEDLAGAAESVAVARAMNANDGRIGQVRAQVDEYGKPIIPGVLARSNVLDASEGANYSGGSSYHPGLPLLPSSIGLAGGLGGLSELSFIDALDGVGDLRLGLSKQIAKQVGANAIRKIFKRAQGLKKQSAKGSVSAEAKLQMLGNRLATVRQVRRSYAQRRPLWAR